MKASELVHSAQRGDAEAFGELMKACQEKCYRIAYSYVKNREDALDVVGESVCKAYVNLRTLKNPEYFNTWLIRIVINEAVNHVNKSRRVARTASVNRAPVQQDVTQAIEAIDLHEAMHCLNQNQKTVIILKYFEDLPLTQIADIMQRPVGTVKTYLHGALQALRLEVKEVIP